MSLARDVNSVLCRPPSGASTESPSGGTIDLVHYLNGLKAGTFAFTWTMDPEDARKELGFSNRFRAGYGLLVDEAKRRMDLKGTVHIDEVVDYLSGIIKEQEAVDRLPARSGDYASAILYLVALENATCAFPYVLEDVPTPAFVAKELSKVHPDKTISADPAFIFAYFRTVAFGAEEIRRRGSVSIYRLIDEWRRSLVQRASKEQ